MVNKEQLLEKLQEYDYFVVDKLVDLQKKPRRGIMQTSIYHNVELHWNGTYFKFWNKKCEDVDLLLDSNVKKIEWDNNVVTIHIVDCQEAVEIRCGKHGH